MRYDDAYQNAKYIPGGDTFPPRWERASATFRDALGARARPGLRYGADENAWFDLFLPEAEPEGLVIFIHGGYWLRFGPRISRTSRRVPSPGVALWRCLPTRSRPQPGSAR